MAETLLITPVCNGEKFLPAYLDSVLEQTERDFEVILVNDGSTDRTPEIAETYAGRFRRQGISFTLLTQPHAGQAAAMNTALARADAEYLLWCDADDLLLPDNLKKKRDFLAAHPEFGMVRHGNRIMDEPGRELRNKWDKPLADEMIFDDLFRNRTFCFAGCYLLRTGLFRDCYPDMQIPVSPEGQNLQMLLPPASRTRCGAIPEPLFIKRKLRDSHCHAPRNFNQRRLRIRAFHQLRLDLLPRCEVDRDYYAALSRTMMLEEEKYLILELLQQRNAAAGRRN